MSSKYTNHQRSMWRQPVRGWQRLLSASLAVALLLTSVPVAWARPNRSSLRTGAVAENQGAEDLKRTLTEPPAAFEETHQPSDLPPRHRPLRGRQQARLQARIGSLDASLTVVGILQRFDYATDYLVEQPQSDGPPIRKVLKVADGRRLRNNPSLRRLMLGHAVRQAERLAETGVVPQIEQVYGRARDTDTGRPLADAILFEFREGLDVRTAIKRGVIEPAEVARQYLEQAETLARAGLGWDVLQSQPNRFVRDHSGHIRWTTIALLHARAVESTDKRVLQPSVERLLSAEDVTAFRVLQDRNLELLVFDPLFNYESLTGLAPDQEVQQRLWSAAGFGDRYGETIPIDLRFKRPVTKDNFWTTVGSIAIINSIVSWVGLLAYFGVFGVWWFDLPWSLLGQVSLWFLALYAPAVIVHEAGHYLLARAFGGEARVGTVGEGRTRNPVNMYPPYYDVKYIAQILGGAVMVGFVFLVLPWVFLSWDTAAGYLVATTFWGWRAGFQQLVPMPVNDGWIMMRLLRTQAIRAPEYRDLLPPLDSPTVRGTAEPVATAPSADPPVAVAIGGAVQAGDVPERSP